MLILPAIDLRGGHCVRLAQGDYNQEKIYDDDPVRVARQFQDQGAEWVHVVDLDGAKSGTPLNISIVERIAKETDLKVEFGGGIRSLEAARDALDKGVERVVVGSSLVKQPELSGRMFAELGPQIVAGIDARGGLVATEGWTKSATLTAVELAVMVSTMGCQRLILTDIARDGMLTGPNIEFLLDVTRAVRIPIIQSGGVSGIDDVLALKKLGNEAPECVIVGRAIYEGRFDLAEALRQIRLE